MACVHRLLNLKGIAYGFLGRLALAESGRAAVSSDGADVGTSRGASGTDVGVGNILPSGE